MSRRWRTATRLVLTLASIALLAITWRVVTQPVTPHHCLSVADCDWPYPNPFD